VLAFIAGGIRLYITPEHIYKPKEGVWKYTELYAFIKENEPFFKSVMPSFNRTTIQ
jgi:hypothetical protein